MSLSGKTLLVTGAAGMLSAQFIPVLQASGARLLLTDYQAGSARGYSWKALDITDPLRVEAAVSDAKPDWVINCAAFTRVDEAEKNYQAAFSANAIGPQNLARAAAKHRASLLQISTDYVFGGQIAHGERRLPFKEDEPVAPCGLYGYSKYFGEECVREILPASHLIVRTSWLHGLFGPNFIETILCLAREKEELRIVNDQFGSPTWAGWLAEVLFRLLAADSRGVFHASSRGDVSWFDIATEIARQGNLSLRILPQTTVELNRPAPRPAYSTLDVSKLESFLGKPCPSWQEHVALHLESRKLQPMESAS